MDPDLVVLGGAGHVGLPLALSFADAGLGVGIYDTNQAVLDEIAAGRAPFVETGVEEMLARVLASGRLQLSADAEILGRTSNVVVVIGTPIDEFLSPSMSIFDRMVEQVAPHLVEGALLILRSTVYPGTTRHVAQSLAARGLAVDVAFCPERIAEGHALEEIRSLPQIIGTETERAAARAEILFRYLAADIIHVRPDEAELAKLLTNTWRYLKFAAANQFLVIAADAGIDYNQVLRAVRTNYPRAADLPGPGFAAGPCLFKDTMQLAAYTRDRFPLGQAAMQVNEGLPAFVVDAMTTRFGALEGRRVGLLGMAFKAESDDPRASLSYKLRKLLLWRGAEVLCSDPYIADPRFVDLNRVMTEAEIIVIGAPHRIYQTLPLADRDLVDVWGITKAGIVL
jgi:UDP-N-acetyl-D-mannosaminuronic acid dehydrogenase